MKFVFVPEGLLLLTLTVAIVGAIPMRKLRVKTIENITAEVTTTIKPTTTLKPTDFLHESSTTASPLLSLQQNQKMAKNAELRQKSFKSNSTKRKVPTKNTVISSSSQFVVTSDSGVNEHKLNTSNRNQTNNTNESDENQIKAAKQLNRGDNHIHVESNYSVLSEPDKRNNTDFNWKSSRIKSNVRRKNILSRTKEPLDRQAAESVPRAQIQLPQVQLRRGIQNVTNVPNPTSRPLLKARKVGASVYNFETGKLQQKNVEDQSSSTSNEVPTEERAIKKQYKQEEGTTNIPRRRFSSRYKKPDAQKQLKRGNHLKEEVAFQPSGQHIQTTPASLFTKEYTDYTGPDKEGEPTKEPLQITDEPNDGKIKEDTKVDEEDQEKSADLKNDSSESKSTHEENKSGDAGKDEKIEKGSGGEHHENNHAVKGQKVDKGYKGNHHFDKASKGFHDKERHSGQYKDEKGSAKSHNEGGGHFEAGKHEEKGQKNAEHAEKEEYKKGHSTRGGHTVHKLDEYEKKLEFYDESHESGDGEKFGAHFESYGGKKGGHKKGGKRKSESEESHAGKKGKFAKGKHFNEEKGHDKKSGKDGHYGHAEKYGKKGNSKSDKKYHYSQGKGKDSQNGGSGKGNLMLLQEEPASSGNLEIYEETIDRVDNGNAREVPINSHHDNVQVAEKEVNEKKSDHIHPTGTIEDNSHESDVNLEVEGDSVEEYSREINGTNQKIAMEKRENVELMDEDGPTSFFTFNNQKKDYRVPQENKKEAKLIGIPTGMGYINEEDLQEDKGEDDALELLEEVQEDGEHRLQRSYEVREDAEPSNGESQIYSHRIQYEPVKILTRSILPPLV